MKYIIAVIQPDKLDAALDELKNREIHMVTVTTVMGRSRQKGFPEVYRSHKEIVSMLRKIKLEIAVNEEYVETTVDAIVKSMGTCQTGDGKISVLDLEKCVRIRTEEHGKVVIG